MLRPRARGGSVVINSVVSAGELEHFNVEGYVVLENLLAPHDLEAAQSALGLHYPSPAEYFANPDAHAWLRGSQFAGLSVLPFRDFALNRLTVHRRITAAVKTLLGIDDIRLCKAELWAKYGNAAEYDQEHHRDYGNHTLTVPRRDGVYREATTFIFLSDVTAQTSPPALVPRRVSDTVPYGVMRARPGSFRDDEVHVTGRAGSVLVYAYDLFHRGTSMLDPRGSRFILLADYRDATATWIGKHAFGARALEPQMAELLAAIEPDQRTLLDFPAPGHTYWNPQTVEDCQRRYPTMDMTPYRSE